MFENPYLNLEESMNTVGNAQFMKAGYEAQLKSVVVLKNKKNVLPLKKEITVYMPKRYTPPARDFFGNVSQEKWKIQ